MAETWQSSSSRRADAPLRVLFVAEGNPEDASASGSGTPKFVIDHLRGHGAEVVSADIELYGAAKLAALARTWAPRRRRWVAKYHLSPASYAMRSANALAAIERLAGRADVVLQYGGTFGAVKSPLPYFLYCDSNTLLSSAEPRSWGAALTRRQLEAAVECQRRVYRNAAAIFTFSDYVRGSFIRDFGLAPERVVTVHAGPNFDRIDPLPHEGESRSGAPTILFVGREFERKGGPVLLEAFRRVRAELPDARLLIAGPERLDVADAGVVHLGYLRKSDPAESRRLREAYAEADVFCLPTRHEPFGIAVLEAMFAGLPVVATDVWAIPEMVEEGVTGHTVPRDDPTSLAARLLPLLRDRALARRMGAAGRARAESHFTWSRVARDMLRVMEAVVAPGALAAG